MNQLEDSSKTNCKRGIALVTGGSRGIGRGIAQHLAAAGFVVAINYRSDQAAAEQCVEELTDRHGLDCAHAIKADVSEPTAQADLLKQLTQHWPDQQLTCLVNNAGITRDNLLIRMKPEEWSAVIETNLEAVRSLSMQALPLLQESGGQIINLSSVVGLHGNAGQANYAAAKSGVIALTKLMSRLLMPLVRVNCIAPGLVATDMTAEFDLNALSETRLGRAGAPADIAQAVRWLAIQAPYVTGQVVSVDGGLMHWSEVSELVTAGS